MANTKTTGLTANTDLQLTDLLLMVNDPSGSPLSQKMQAQYTSRVNIFNVPLAGGIFTGAATSVVSNNGVLVFRDSNTDVADYSFVTPRLWASGSVTIDLIWVAASGSGNIVTSVETRTVQNGSALSSGSTSSASATVAVTTSAVRQSYASLTGFVENQSVNIRIFRSGSNGSDTLAASAYLLAIALRLL